MAYVVRAFFGPNLYRVYDALSSANGDRTYHGNAAERYGNLVISVIQSIFSLCYYSSPFLMVHLYRREWGNLQGATLIVEILAGFGCLYVAALCVRTVGRSFDPTYTEFLGVLAAARSDLNQSNMRMLARYDFDFHAWPVEFVASGGADRRLLVPPSRQQLGFASSFPSNVLSWLMVQSFGISLVYPGSIRLLQAGLSDALRQGREKQIVEKSGKRSKLLAADGNAIDVMFFDRRNATERGSTLVVSCEGNAGFYEVGMLSTPIEAGHSVLGWNHPGFGGSTGAPFPSQEANAIDAVMQFAINRLGFRPEDIVVHGWSIGGFTASWAAMNYPDVKGVVLDATFDDLLPLAVPRMPEFVEPLVRFAVSNYINLNVADQLVRYNGPILLVRRLHDEMITTNPQDLSSNRGNSLLRRLLMHRYPFLFDADETVRLLEAYLSLDKPSGDELWSSYNVEEQEVLRLLSAASLGVEHSASFPSRLGEDLSVEDKARLVLYLAVKYMAEFDSTHCTQLPVRYFDMIWDQTSVAEDNFLPI